MLKATFCVKCNESIELLNMGEQALRSHMKSKKHLKSMGAMNVFFQPRWQPVITTTTGQSTAEPSVSTCSSKTINIGSKLIIC